MQCLHQVAVPVGIYITAYDWDFLQVWVGSGNPLLGFELLLDLHPDPTTLSNSFEVWSLQEDWKQHLGHLLQELQNTSDLHTMHCLSSLFKFTGTELMPFFCGCPIAKGAGETTDEFTEFIFPCQTLKSVRILVRLDDPAPHCKIPVPCAEPPWTEGLNFDCHLNEL